MIKKRKRGNLDFINFTYVGCPTGETDSRSQIPGVGDETMIASCDKWRSGTVIVSVRAWGRASTPVDGDIRKIELPRPLSGAKIVCEPVECFTGGGVANQGPVAELDSHLENRRIGKQV